MVETVYILLQGSFIKTTYMMVSVYGRGSSRHACLKAVYRRFCPPFPHLPVFGALTDLGGVVPKVRDTRPLVCNL